MCDFSQKPVGKTSAAEGEEKEKKTPVLSFQPHCGVYCGHVFRRLVFFLVERVANTLQRVTKTGEAFCVLAEKIAKDGSARYLPTSRAIPSRAETFEQWSGDLWSTCLWPREGEFQLA